MDQKITRAVVGFIIKDNQVLLGLRKKVSWGLGRNLISGIGGKVGDSPEIVNETDEQALVREFKEEIGVIPKSFQWVGKVKFIFPNKPKWDQEVEVYTISQWQNEPQETEIIKPEWYEKDNLPFEQMWDDAKFWVPKVLKGGKISLQMTYDEENKKVKEICLL